MPFRGFDTDVFPGFDAMTDLRRDFDLVGFYLRAPSHPDQSWSGKRSGLAQLGYGFLPIFVGQQVVGPGSHILTAEQGELDGVAACQAMFAEGFVKGSKVFLDLENGPPFGTLQTAYVFAVIKAVAAGGMVAGVYASHMLAPALAMFAPSAPLWIFKVPTVARTAAAPPFTAPNPVLGGRSEAVAWQYRQNVQISVGGHDLVVDLDTATTADPSAPG